MGLHVLNFPGNDWRDMATAARKFADAIEAGKQHILNGIID